jgi:hypothetical protein
MVAHKIKFVPFVPKPSHRRTNPDCLASPSVKAVVYEESSASAG